MLVFHPASTELYLKTRTRHESDLAVSVQLLVNTRSPIILIASNKAKTKTGTKQSALVAVHLDINKSARGIFLCHLRWLTTPQHAEESPISCFRHIFRIFFSHKVFQEIATNVPYSSGCMWHSCYSDLHFEIAKISRSQPVRLYWKQNGDIITPYKGDDLSR